MARWSPLAASSAADTTAGAGVMCPSYLATRDEKDSTRARARVLQEMVNGTQRRVAINLALAGRSGRRRRAADPPQQRLRCWHKPGGQHRILGATADLHRPGCSNAGSSLSTGSAPKQATGFGEDPASSTRTATSSSKHPSGNQR